MGLQIIEAERHILNLLATVLCVQIRKARVWMREGFANGSINV